MDQVRRLETKGRTEEGADVDGEGRDSNVANEIDIFNENISVPSSLCRENFITCYAAIASLAFLHSQQDQKVSYPSLYLQRHGGKQTALTPVPPVELPYSRVFDIGALMPGTDVHVFF